VTKNKITYISNPQRTNRIIDDQYAKDFLYFYHKLDENQWDKNILELNDNKLSNFLERTLFVIEKVIIKYFKLPFYGHKLNLKKNYQTIKQSDFIVLLNETMAYSTIFILMFIKLFKKQEVILFVMGLFNQTKSNSFKKIIINLMLKNIDKFIFLSKGELIYATDKHSNYKKKFFYLGFSIDSKFWIIENKKFDKTAPILFNGNDTHRDYDLLSQIVKKCSTENFIIVSNKFKESNLSNVQIIDTSLSSNKLSDSQLREVYSKTKMSIIPLKETLQPSGQSVALQSMLTRNIVLISKTRGFWDYDKFEDNENIVFVDNNLDSWLNAINSVNQDSINSKKVLNNAKNIVKKEYSIDKNFDKFLEILFK